MFEYMVFITSIITVITITIELPSMIILPYNCSQLVTNIRHFSLSVITIKN